jgi:hypothetical protein
MTVYVGHRLSDETGVRENARGITLEDTTGYSPRRITSLTDGEVGGLIEWYYDGRCPVCGTEINVGEVICDSCFENASRFPARADALAAQEAR